MKKLDFNCPEIEELEKIAGQYDFLLQEGVFYTKKEKERALFLLTAIENLVNQLNIKEVKMTKKDIKKRLEYLRKEIEAERISYGEIVELQSLVKYIEKEDVVLLEWAGVKE